MSNQQQLINVIKSFAGQANILAVPVVFIRFCGGDLAAAILLSQIIYWSDKSSRSDGWFYKSFREWDEEISLTQFQVSKATRKFRDDGFLEIKRKMANGHPTNHYKLNTDVFANAIIKFLDNEETSQSIMNKLDNGLSINSTMDYEETSQSITETTSETTSQITQEITEEEDAKPARKKKPTPPPTAPSLRVDRMTDAQEAFALWYSATGMMAYGGYNQDQLPAKLIAIIKQEGSFDAAAALCKRAYQTMLTKRRADGREYSKLSPMWLDWALAHEIPGDKPEGKKVIKLD